MALSSFSGVHFFGVRHHGPGCARSLVKALDALQPDAVLIEGPPEADALTPLVLSPAMQPPVAILTYCPDDASLAVYHPFAEFSPEWQAMRWARQAGVTTRFIDLPLAHSLATEKEKREAEKTIAADVVPVGEVGEDTTLASEDAHEEPLDAAPQDPRIHDPLHWLAQAAGYADGETWWNHMVEERGDGQELFAAIAEAMTTLRAQWGEHHHSAERQQHEAWREAHMRQAIRGAQKDGLQRIAVVCGAWHLGGLLAETTAKADQSLLKGLPKVKVQSTWVPWTYRHLARASGYGAGITSPGWYEHLWNSHDNRVPRAVGWLARVARLMRERDLDCSSAHLIEAARLADSLAALRDRPAPGLDELHEASRAVLTLGDDAVLHFIQDALVVGDRLGQVPPDVPTVPLQRDVEQAQKSLRLKPEALQKNLDLDLRNTNDLARSHLLHRLSLLDIPWGSVAKVGRSSRGTFHEVWTLQWQPEFALRLIEASQWGQTLEQAATAAVMNQCKQTEDLADLSALVDRVLLADLSHAVQAVTQSLQDRAALTGDAQQLLAALPPLANVFRYGSVRQTDASLVGHVLDGLILRTTISLPLACQALDDSAAEVLRDKLLAAHGAVNLRQDTEQTALWQQALSQLAVRSGTHELLQGLAVRLLLDADAQDWPTDRVAQTLGLQLSAGADPACAAAWLDGFLNRNAVVLLHDTAVWQLVDAWLARLSPDHFVRVLPMVRRTFSAFGGSERRDLAQRASQGITRVTSPAAAVTWDETRAALVLPVLRQIFGVPA